MMRFFFLSVLLCFHCAQAEVSFLTISDIHYGKNNPSKAGYDTGKVLFQASLDKFQALANRVDFIIALGDFPTHLLWSKRKKIAYIKDVFSGLYQADDHHKPLFYVTGNNDSLQSNYGTFSRGGISPLTFADHWQGACAYCDGLIIDKTHMFDQGYYSSYVIPGNASIVLIALNSVLFASPPFFILPSAQHQAAEQELQWLAQQLQTHHAKQLLIAMHIPPGKTYKGKSLWKKPYVEQFIRLLSQAESRYDQITLLTSHTHMDEIRRIVLKSRHEKLHPIYAFSTPSISPIYHNNPSMKVFVLNAELQLNDYKTYYTTSYDQWGDDHYRATHGKESIFPECRQLTLAQCLDQQTKHSVCNKLGAGFYYGSKSTSISGETQCVVTYSINDE